jgi:hypothetical protein
MKLKILELLFSKWQLVVFGCLLNTYVLAQGSISGSTSVCVNTTNTYSFIGATCSSYSWAVTGGTITSNFGSQINVTWNTTGGTGTINVTATGCSPSNSTIYASLNVTRIVGAQEIQATYPTSTTMNLTAIGSNASSFSWSFSGFTGLSITSQSGNTISISFTSRNPQVTVCVSALPPGCGKTTGSNQTCANNL